MNCQMRQPSLSASVSFPKSQQSLFVQSRHSIVHGKTSRRNWLNKNEQTRARNNTNLVLSELSSKIIEEPQITPKFKGHKKTESSLSSYTHSSTQSLKYAPIQYSLHSKETLNPENIQMLSVKKLAPFQLSLSQFDQKTISGKNTYKKSSKTNRPFKRNTAFNTERTSRKKHQDDILERLQTRLSSLQKLIEQLDKIKKHQQSDKVQRQRIKSQRKTQTMKKLAQKYERSTLPKHKKMSLKDFIILGEKGKGQFGQVYLALHRQTGMIVALKSQSKAQLIRRDMVKRFILEVKINFYLDHPNISKLYGIFDDDKCIYMIMEYMHDGSLYNTMRRNKKLTQQQASTKLDNICSALKELHKHSIIHRDIKPQNIIVNMEVCKLCDFGWSIMDNERRQTYCGTFDYLPPEILKGQKYNYSIDLWELGVLAYEMITGQLPFYHLSRKQTYHRITNVNIGLWQFQNQLLFPKNTSKQAINFVNQLLRKNPEDRKTVSELKMHPFLKKFRENLH